MCYSCWSWCSGWKCRGKHSLLNYVIFIMRAQYTLLLNLRGSNTARQGSTKQFPCRVTCIYRGQFLRICNDSTSEPIILPTFRIVNNSSSLISKIMSSLLQTQLPKKTYCTRNIDTQSILKCYSASLATNHSTRKLLQRVIQRFGGGGDVANLSPFWEGMA